MKVKYFYWIIFILYLNEVQNNNNNCGSSKLYTYVHSTTYASNETCSTTNDFYSVHFIFWQYYISIIIIVSAAIYNYI